MPTPAKSGSKSPAKKPKTKSDKPKTSAWPPALSTTDGIEVSLNALRWRRLGAASLGAGPWRQTRVHYLRRLALQLGTRGVVAESTLPKGKPPAACVEAELVSGWSGDQVALDGEDSVAMSRLTLLFFLKAGEAPEGKLKQLVSKLDWAETAHVVAA